jgi:photosystem II stability/assembly factor-like uncharacterized protein
MRKTAMFHSKGHSVNNLLLLFFLPVTFLSLIVFPPVQLYASWEPVGPEGGHFIFSMTNPANADEIIAITSSPSPSNIYKSTDGGASWSKIGEIPDPDVNDVSAFDFSTLYAITISSCYRSTDGGFSWSEARLPSSSGSAYCVCAHPTDSRIVYAAGHYRTSPTTQTMVFLKSTDGGQSWSASQFFSFKRLLPYDMAISNTDPNVIYICGRKEAGGSHYAGFLFTTSDGGNTWTDISSAVERNPRRVFRSVAVDPTDDGKVYVGGPYFYRGTKTGPDSDLSWTRSPRPFLPFTVFSIGIDPVDPSRIYIGMGEGVTTSTNYGESWTLLNNTIKSKVGHIAAAPADPSKVYASSSTGFYRSQNYGSSWDTAHNGIYAVSINAMDVDPQMILIADGRYLMSYGRERNFAWENIVTPASCTIGDILINPDNPNIVLIIEGYG